MGQRPRASINKAENSSLLSVVGKVTIEYRSQPGALFAGRQVPMGPAPVLDRGQRAGKPAFGRGLPHHVLALPRFAQEWVKPRKSNEWALQSGGIPP